MASADSICRKLHVGILTAATEGDFVAGEVHHHISLGAVDLVLSKPFFKGHGAIEIVAKSKLLSEEFVVAVEAEPDNIAGFQRCIDLYRHTVNKSMIGIAQVHDMRLAVAV